MIKVNRNVGKYAECVGCRSGIHKQKYNITIGTTESINTVITLCEDCMKSLANSVIDTLEV